MNYYEIEFGDAMSGVDCDHYSICIRGERKPTIKEAEEFCKTDMRLFGYRRVTDVLEITSKEAHDFFDMRNEEQWPVFK